jgi:flagellar motor component MotA
MNPVFIRVNVLITGVGAGIFLVNLALNAGMLVTPGTIRGIVQVITYIVLVGGIVFTLWYPEHIRKKQATVSSQNTVNPGGVKE